MTLMERFETVREQLLHAHHDKSRDDEQPERPHAARDHHHVDLSTGSEFLDVI